MDNNGENCSDQRRSDGIVSKRSSSACVDEQCNDHMYVRYSKHTYILKLLNGHKIYLEQGSNYTSMHMPDATRAEAQKSRAAHALRHVDRKVSWV